MYQMIPENNYSFRIPQYQSYSASISNDVWKIFVYISSGLVLAVSLAITILIIVHITTLWKYRSVEDIALMIAVILYFLLQVIPVVLALMFLSSRANLTNWLPCITILIWVVIIFNLIVIICVGAIFIADNQSQFEELVKQLLTFTIGCCGTDFSVLMIFIICLSSYKAGMTYSAYPYYSTVNQYDYQMRY